MPGHHTRMCRDLFKRNDPEVFPLATFIVGYEHVVRKNTAERNIIEIHCVQSGVLSALDRNIVLHQEAILCSKTTKLFQINRYKLQ